MDFNMLVILIGLHIVYFAVKSVDSIINYIHKDKKSSKVSGV